MRFSYKRALVYLDEYAVKEGYANIIFHDNGDSKITWAKNTLNEPKKIYIDAKATLEIKTYLTLHELGHHLIRKDWAKFKKKLPVAAFAERKHVIHKDKKYMRRDSYVIASLEEEFMAWEEGLRLGLKLGIKVNMDKWIDFKSKCLKSYIVYYANLKK